MILDHGAPLFDESPTAHRILAIDDQMAALDRVRPKARYLWYGTALLAAILLWSVMLVAAGTGASDALLRVMIFVAVPGLVFAGQLARNTNRRHRLERELDSLIAEPGESSRRRSPDALPDPEAD